MTAEQITYTPAMFKADLQQLSGKAFLATLEEPHTCAVEGCTGAPVGIGTTPDDAFSFFPLCEKHSHGVEGDEAMNVSILNAELAAKLIKMVFVKQAALFAMAGSLPFYGRTPAAVCGNPESNHGTLFLTIEGQNGGIPFAMPYEPGDLLFLKSAEIDTIAGAVSNGQSLSMMIPSPDHRMLLLEASADDFVPIAAMNPEVIK